MDSRNPNGAPDLAYEVMALNGALVDATFGEFLQVMQGQLHLHRHKNVDDFRTGNPYTMLERAASEINKAMRLMREDAKPDEVIAASADGANYLMFAQATYLHNYVQPKQP